MISSLSFTKAHTVWAIQYGPYNLCIGISDSESTRLKRHQFSANDMVVLDPLRSAPKNFNPGGHNKKPSTTMTVSKTTIVERLELFQLHFTKPKRHEYTNTFNKMITQR